MRIARAGQQFRHQQHEQRDQDDRAGQSLLGSRFHGANYIPRNSSAGPTVRNEPNTSTRSPGTRRGTRDAARLGYVGACARHRRVGRQVLRRAARAHGARAGQRHEDPGVDFARQRGGDAADVLVAEDAADGERAPARGSRRRLSRSVSAAGTLCATSSIHSTSPGTVTRWKRPAMRTSRSAARRARA